MYYRFALKLYLENGNRIYILKQLFVNKTEDHILISIYSEHVASVSVFEKESVILNSNLNC